MKIDTRRKEEISQIRGNLSFFLVKWGKPIDNLYKIHKMKEVRDINMGNLTKTRNGINWEELSKIILE